MPLVGPARDLPFQVAFVYDPKSREHGMFFWHNNDVSRARRYWIGEREQMWDGPREKIGDPAFFRLLRGWATQNRYGTVTTPNAPDLAVLTTGEGLNDNRVIYKYIPSDDCAVVEGCVGAPAPPPRRPPPPPWRPAAPPPPPPRPYDGGFSWRSP